MDNLSKYLEDTSFIKWVFDPTTELDLFWEHFSAEHPEEARNIRMARRLILQFRVVAKTLSEEEKILLFSRVLKDIENKQKTSKLIRFIPAVLKYAAVAIIFFSIGALLFYREKDVDQNAYFANLNEQAPENQAQLIRSNGENIILSDQRSVIKYQKSGDLVVNSDTLKPTKTAQENSKSLNQLIIPYGKTSEILLPDGTKVLLNAGSRLAYPDHFVGESREVVLLGEAFFDVKHDAKRPFVVQVNGLRIKDLGTRFNVSAYSADALIETVLAEGKVSIRQNNSSLFAPATELVPGQLATFDRQNDRISVQQVNVEDYILWTQGLMKFETVDLSRIVKKLERYYNIRFQFDDPMLGALKISGKLELKEDRNEILDRIARTASVKIVKEGEDFYTILK